MLSFSQTNRFNPPLVTRNEIQQKKLLESEHADFAKLIHGDTRRRDFTGFSWFSGNHSWTQPSLCLISGCRVIVSLLPVINSIVQGHASQWVSAELESSVACATIFCIQRALYHEIYPPTHRVLAKFLRIKISKCFCRVSYRFHQYVLYISFF